jgi:hypothetical protein
MAGLVPAIHAFLAVFHQGVDARDKRGHDEENWPAMSNSRGDTSACWRSATPMFRSRSCPAGTPDRAHA